MIIKIIDQNLYKVLLGWWTHYNFPKMPFSMLPTETSYMAFVGDKPICATLLFLPIPGSYKVGWTFFFSKNPDATHDEAVEGFKLLNDHVEDMCQLNGCIAVFTFVGNESLVHRLETSGFIPVEPGTLMTKTFVGL